jgi:hypothetical protein
VNDKEFTVLAILAGMVGILWWLIERNKSQSTTPAGQPDAFPVNPDWPMSAVTGDQFEPANLNVNIANQSANLLSNQYIPLFGFVGMAQGSFYQ